MKTTSLKRNYRFSPVFKIGTIWVLVFAAFGIVGAIALFMFGVARIFMGVYNQAAVSNSALTWGIVCMCLGGYLVLMNAFSLATTSLAINRRTARKTLILAILAILAIGPMVGGIILLFTPLNSQVSENQASQHANSSNSFSSSTPEVLVTKESANDPSIENLTSQLRNLKSRIDQGVATDEEEVEFARLQNIYRQRHSGNRL